MIIPEELTMTTKNDQILLHDRGGSQSRFVIITTAKNLTTLGECQEWAGHFYLLHLYLSNCI